MLFNSHIALMIRSSQSSYNANNNFSIYNEARNKIEEDVNKIITRLNAKKAEVFEKIGNLEKTFTEKQKEQESDLNALKFIKTKTEGLRQDGFRELQCSVMKELDKGIEKLRFEIEESKRPDYQIEIKWGMSLTNLLSQIYISDIIVSQIAQRDKLESQRSESNQPINTLKRDGHELEQTELKKPKSPNPDNPRIS